MEKKTISTPFPKRISSKMGKGGKNNSFVLKERKGWLRRGCDWKGK
jgi:hypothetical protein